MSEQGDGGGEPHPFGDTRDVPVVILAGGRGARFDHESQVRPKPMIEVVGKPILQHIVDGFVAQGFREFIVATGHLGGMINRHFDASASIVSCPRFDSPRPWFWAYLSPHGNETVAVYVAETGEEAHTGLRLARLSPLIRGRDFVLTYGDGLCDVDMRHLIAVHRHEQPHLAPTVTVTAVNPPGRFGVIDMEPGTGFPHFQLVRTFDEKPRTDQWINGGFMFAENSFLDFVADGQELEAGALQEVARRHGLCAYLHRGYWRCMDTRRDKEQIEADVAAAGRLPWLCTQANGDRMEP